MSISSVDMWPGGVAGSKMEDACNREAQTVGQTGTRREAGRRGRGSFSVEVGDGIPYVVSVAFAPSQQPVLPVEQLLCFAGAMSSKSTAVAQPTAGAVEGGVSPATAPLVAHPAATAGAVASPTAGAVAGVVPEPADVPVPQDDHARSPSPARSSSARQSHSSASERVSTSAGRRATVACVLEERRIEQSGIMTPRPSSPSRRPQAAAKVAQTGTRTAGAVQLVPGRNVQPVTTAQPAARGAEPPVLVKAPPGYIASRPTGQEKPAATAAVPQDGPPPKPPATAVVPVAVPKGPAARMALAMKEHLLAAGVPSETVRDAIIAGLRAACPEALPNSAAAAEEEAPTMAAPAAPLISTVEAWLGSVASGSADPGPRPAAQVGTAPPSAARPEHWDQYAPGRATVAVEEREADRAHQERGRPRSASRARGGSRHRSPSAGADDRRHRRHRSSSRARAATPAPPAGGKGAQKGQEPRWYGAGVWWTAADWARWQPQWYGGGWGKGYW